MEFVIVSSNNKTPKREKKRDGVIAVIVSVGQPEQ